MDGVFEWYQWNDIKIIFIGYFRREEAFGRLTKRRICKDCGRLIPWVGDFKNIEKCDKCGGELISRDDDNLEAIKARLDFYKKDVEPAVSFYKEQNRLIKVDGDQSIEGVYSDIKKAIK